MKPFRIVVSCEHASNAIPAILRRRIRIEPEILKGHRGWDIGALALAKTVAPALNAKLVAATFSRLVVDANRNERHPRVFSEYSRGLDEADRNALLEAYHRPYRASVEREVRNAMASGPVLHLSIHSFTPVLNGVTRNTEVGLLFDPRRTSETQFCRELQRKLGDRLAPMRIRRNYPYRGTSDGLTTVLRGKFPARQYVGVEIEINQARLMKKSEVHRLAAHLVSALT